MRNVKAHYDESLDNEWKENEDVESTTRLSTLAETSIQGTLWTECQLRWRYVAQSDES